MWCISTLSTEDDGRQTFQYLSRSFRQSVQDSPLGFCHADLTPDTIRDRFTCQCVNVVYSIICRCCGCLYIGETGRRLRERIGEYLSSIRNNCPGFPVAEHFNSASHSLNDIMICGLKRCSGDNTRRNKQEMRLIFELGTLKLNGLNINFSFI